MSKQKLFVKRGTYTTTQRLTIGNVTKVNIAEIGEQPATNPLIALRGELSGLNIHQTDGYISDQTCNYKSSLDLQHIPNGDTPESP